MLDSPRCKYSLKHSWISPTAASRPARTRSLNPIQLTTSFAPGSPRTRPPLCLSRNSIHCIAGESLCALATARLELRLAHWVLIFLWCTQGRLYIHPASYGTSVVSSALHRFNWFPPSLSGSLCSVLSFFPLYRFRVASWLYTDVCRVNVHDGGLCSGSAPVFTVYGPLAPASLFLPLTIFSPLIPASPFPTYYNPPPLPVSHRWLYSRTFFCIYLTPWLFIVIPSSLSRAYAACSAGHFFSRSSFVFREQFNVSPFSLLIGNNPRSSGMTSRFSDTVGNDHGGIASCWHGSKSWSTKSSSESLLLHLWAPGSAGFRCWMRIEREKGRCRGYLSRLLWQSCGVKINHLILYLAVASHADL